MSFPVHSIVTIALGMAFALMVVLMTVMPKTMVMIEATVTWRVAASKATAWSLLSCGDKLRPQQVGSRIWIYRRHPLVLEQDCGANIANHICFMDKSCSSKWQC